MKCKRIVLTLLVVSVSSADGQTVDRGREVAAEANRRAVAFGDVSATLRMIVRNGRGVERIRELSVAVLEVEGAGERSLVRFETPRDLRGTALLTVNNGDGSSDQWLYLPALRRTKRIAGANRSGSFMGSEFSYEDIGTMDIDRYLYRLVRTDSLDGMPVWIVERRPKDTSSQYGKQHVWFDQQEYRVLRIDYYDRRDIALKTLTMRNFQRYGNQFWRPDEMEMTNHRTRAITLLEWSHYVFGSDLALRDFEPNRLGREG